MIHLNDQIQNNNLFTNATSHELAIKIIEED